MSHHQYTLNGRLHTGQTASATGIRNSSGNPSAGDEELAAEVDEPPEHRPRAHQDSYHKILPSPAFSVSKTSLLTQGLLSGSDVTSGSEAEAPVLTSDGGLTSPTRTTTPSPPPPSVPFQPNRQPTKDFAVTRLDSNPPSKPQVDNVATDVKAPEKSLEAGLARRRRITFACGAQKKQERKEAEAVSQATTAVSPAPTKRPCMLKFVCPFKPSTAEKTRHDCKQQRTPTPAPPPLSRRESAPESATSGTNTAKPLFAGAKLETVEPALRPTSSQLHLKPKSLQKSEAARFHEFAVDSKEQDDWTKEQISRTRKMTIDDTLRKENEIRKLAQEAEDEADDETPDAKHLKETDDSENDEDAELDISDGGNESDDEGGFGDSDDESEGWSPSGTAGATTAATSTDHLDHFRPLGTRGGSDSSNESMVRIRGRSSVDESRSRECRGRRRSPRERHRPGTPDLPDSTDFVCGTFDEDRPLENAYRSCVEDRRRSKQHAIPQDVDPTFPTSDSDMDEEDDDDDGMVEKASVDEHWSGRLEMSDEGSPIPEGPSRKAAQSPAPAPKRLRSPLPAKHVAVHRSPPLAQRSTAHRSPPPLKRTVSHKSPPPIKRTVSHRSPAPTKRAAMPISPPARQLFGKSPERIWSPNKFRRHLQSPPSTRLISPRASPHHCASLLEPNRLAQRPHLTYTSSLPKTPNPFWLRHGCVLHDSSDVAQGSGTSRRKPRKNSDLHDRGPIDIVQGLEAKRQRRREKYWKQHCRNAKEKRQHPGQGAERMKEIGLLSSERYKGYGPKLQLMLSI